jgi:hypothetical protein
VADDETTTGMAGTTPDDREIAFSARLALVLDHMARLLEERHRHHGNAALKPEAIFSQASARERLCVMLDYKLARYKQGSSELRGENLDDMLGYLLLLKMLEKT